MKVELNQDLDVSKLKQHDSIVMRNPLSEDFSWKFNGEEYTIKAGEIKAFSKFVTFHLCKHLSTQMIDADARKGMTPEAEAKQSHPIHGKIAQLHIYDTSERRIALYKMLGNADLVQEVIKQYPFKGFIGDMNVYRRFVDEAKKEDIKNDNQTDSD